MTRRDRRWRIGGALLMSAACLAAVTGDGLLRTLWWLPVALLGIPFIVHGKHVVQSLRAERRGHWTTIAAVHRARQGRGR